MQITCCIADSYFLQPYRVMPFDELWRNLDLCLPICNVCIINIYAFRQSNKHGVSVFHAIGHIWIVFLDFAFSHMLSSSASTIIGRQVATSPRADSYLVP